MDGYRRNDAFYGWKRWRREKRRRKKTHANNELNAQRDQVIKRYLWQIYFPSFLIYFNHYHEFETASNTHAVFSNKHSTIMIFWSVVLHLKMNKCIHFQFFFELFDVLLILLISIKLKSNKIKYKLQHIFPLCNILVGMTNTRQILWAFKHSARPQFMNLFRII